MLSTFKSFVPVKYGPQDGQVKLKTWPLNPCKAFYISLRYRLFGLNDFLFKLFLINSGSGSRKKYFFCNFYTHTLRAQNVKYVYSSYLIDHCKSPKTS